MSELSPLILSLKLDQKTFDLFDQLRQQHFPPERNFLPAHLTLFHALPGEQELEIQQLLQERCARTPVLPLSFPEVRSLGQGVAVQVDSPELSQFRQQLADHWQAGLTRQDQQGYRPHITLQNKVAPDVARQLYHQLAKAWTPFNGKGEALLLWRYKGGPWELAGEFAFKTE